MAADDYGNMNRDQLLEYLGVLTWDDVVEWLDGKTISEITVEFNECWPHEDSNDDLAEVVWRRLR